MAYILCIETATTNCSVSIVKNDETVAVIEDNSKSYSHAERLHTSIDAVVKKSGITLCELSAVAVSKGPGSYTGLRIGVSTAKGLCFSLDIPLISVSTLHALASQVEQEEGFIVPMLDARRMEVYTAVFDTKYQLLHPVEAKVLDADAYNTYLDKVPVFFIGNGVTKWKILCTHPKAIFIEDALPSAIQMGKIAYQKYVEKDFEDTAYFEPYYLKDFVAGK